MQARPGVQKVPRWAYPEGSPSDEIVIEEPLEILLTCGSQALKLATTLRTPGHDYELVLGYLYSLGLLQSMAEVQTLSFCGSEPNYNRLLVQYREALPEAAWRMSRPDVTHAGCGACGQTETVESIPAVEPAARPVEPEWLTALPQQLRRAQKLFARCGGTHAAGLANPGENLQLAFEDVGRHNAVDKVVGHLLMEKKLPARQQWLVLSGRAGWELLQKAARAGFAGVASVGAPSTSALSIARTAGLCLVGFVQANRFNVYCRPEAIAGLSAD